MNMETGPLRRGQFIRFNGAAWCIELMRNGVLHLKRHDTGEFEKLSVNDFNVGCYEGSMERVLDPDREVEPSRRELLSVSLSDMDPLMAYTAERKAFYIAAFHDPDMFYRTHYPDLDVDHRVSPINRSKASMREYGPVVRDAWVQHVRDRYLRVFQGVLPPDFERVPGPTAWCGYLDLYNRVGGNQRGLASRYDKRGRTHRDLSPNVLDWLDEAIDTVWLRLRTSPPKMIEVYDALEKRVSDWNDENPRHPLVMPTDRHVRRYIKETVDRRTVCERRKGKAKAEREFGQYGVGPQADYILEIVEVDHTTCDVEVIDDKTDAKLGRPTISVGLDRYSRMPVGAYIGFEGPSTATVMKVLKSVMSPKPFLAEYGIDFPYPWGKPTGFYFDLGPDFNNDDVREPAATLDIRVDYEPAECPEYKGKIERFWRRLQDEIVHDLPGATPPLRKGEFVREPDGRAYIRLSAFRMRVWYWLAMVYAKAPHRGLSLAAPLDRWKDSAAVRLPRPVCRKHDLDTLLTRTEMLVPSKKGVEWKELRWTSPALSIVMAHPSYRKGGKVKVRIDDDDLGRAWVVDPFTRQSVPLNPADSGYMNGLTLYQHENIKRHLKEDNIKRIDFRQLREAKAKLRAEAEGLRQANGPRGRSIKAVARHLAIGAETASDAVPDVRPAAPSAEVAAQKFKVTRVRKYPVQQEDNSDE